MQNFLKIFIYIQKEYEMLVELNISNAQQGHNHQRRALPCDWITESFHRALPDAIAARLSAFTTVFFIHKLLYLRHIRLLLFFLFFPACCFFASAGDIIFSSRETLYSTRTGRSLGELALSVEVKSLNTYPAELYLIIGNENGDIIEGVNGSKTLWIFDRNITLNAFKRELKNNNHSLDINNFSAFVPLSGNDVKFEIKNWAEIVKQTKYVFYTVASLGSEVTLKLHFYTATKDKKKTTLDDDARVTLSFRLAAAAKKPAAVAEAISASVSAPQAQQGQGGGGPSDEDKKKKEEEDAKKQAEAERIQRTNDLNVFITVKNKEMAAMLEEIEVLSKNKKTKVKTFDSLELVVNEMGKKVAYWDKGYTDILLKEEAIQDKFMKFGTDQTIALKMLAAEKQSRTGMPDWLMPVGVGLGVFMFVFSFITQIVARIKAKRKMIKAMKAQGIKAPEKVKKLKGKPKEKEIDTVDINDLYKI